MTSSVAASCTSMCAVPDGVRHSPSTNRASRESDPVSTPVTAWFAPGTASTRTVPAVPSTVSSMPSVSCEVAPVTDRTQGRPTSRETTTAWLLSAPMSTTTAPATRKRGVHAASVSGATMTSPGSSAAAAVRSFTTRAGPV